MPRDSIHQLDLQTKRDPVFVSEGREASKIDVVISYRIIQLFSEGLYSSPHKAIEELVANAFDAGATKTHVIVSPDLASPDSTIAVIDNGTGMDEAGLRLHWRIGVSNKRESPSSRVNGRKQIGKFGIGKLATYVLASRLTHISRTGSGYLATSINYEKIPPGTAGSIQTERMQLPLRELTEHEAKRALAQWLRGSKPGYTGLKLFGQGAERTWTVAIMSNLKPMAGEIRRGRLRWVLATAMPLRDDFQLYLDGERVTPSKVHGKRIGTWVIGKSLVDLPKPAPDNLEVTETDDEDEASHQRYGLTHPQLGRVTGYAELYEDLLTSGKSAVVGRSHGFFVYTHGRLINLDDEYFGIDSNLLRHGTFARFRMVVHVDRLDTVLRSSREALLEGSLVETTRAILRGVFNFVRVAHEQHEEEQDPGLRAALRAADSPASLTRQPIVAMVISALAGRISPTYTDYPRQLTRNQRPVFIEGLQRRADTPEGLVREVSLVEGLSQRRGLAVLDAATGILQINALHPFVAHFVDIYDDKRLSLPLQLLAISEVLLEAHLYELGVPDRVVQDAMAQRDELLRYLAKSGGRRNAYMVAQDLLAVTNRQDELEQQLAAAFDSMGFTGAIRIGGKNKPDGYAEAILGAAEDGTVRSYKVSLEAKSKRRPGEKVSAKDVGIAAVVRHREEYSCDHAVVVGPDFPTSKQQESALAKEIAEDRTAHPGRTISLIRIDDVARLVRLVPAKRIGLDRLQDLFKSCSLPQQCRNWIDHAAAEDMARAPYKEILEVISAEQRDMPGQAIEYSNVVTRLRLTTKVALPKERVIQLCKAMSSMVPEYVSARANTVEASQRPDRVLEAIAAVIRQYPEDEQRSIAL